MGRMRSAIAIATCLRFVGLAKEDQQVIEALHRQGIEAVHAAWDDPDVDWQSFALVVVRSTWDYTDRLSAFLDWTRRLRRVMNSLEVIKWNTDKRYLGDLAVTGLPVIPTRFLEPGDDFEIPNSPFVVKPTVSNGAQDTAWYPSGKADEARKHIRRLQAFGRTAMLQPYLPSVESEGEANLVFIGGRYSHSIRRAALLNRPGFLQVDPVPPVDVRAYKPTNAERALAEEVIAAVPCDSSELLFGRVDLITGLDGLPMVLEVEVTEPALFLGFSESGVERLADCIVAQLGVG